ncbi:hypothetical protein MBLNU459_g7837t2 [Dothideomycetes sp. NU459]
MPPRSKKRRLNLPEEGRSNSAPLPIIPDRATWPGWCEIESEPAFFNVMLHEMGVRGVKIHEVFGLDDELLAILPQPIPDFACASVALLNIVNNIPGLELGPHLQSFKTFSQSFDPLSRGDAIVNFDFVRRTHNSFARNTDMLNVDHLMKDKYVNSMRHEKLEAANAAKAAKAAAKAAEKAAQRAAKECTHNAQSRSNPARKARGSKLTEERGATPEDDGYHFVAYMPIDNQVWKLDGMDRFPQKLGDVAEGGDWMSLIQTALTVRMAQYEDGQIEFSLMAVVKDPIDDERERLADNIKSLQCVESKLSEVFPGWKDTFGPHRRDDTIDGASEKFGITEDAITFACPSEQFLDSLDTDRVEFLMVIRHETINAQADYRAAVRDRLRDEHADMEKARHRRHDYGSFVQAWLEALVKQDALVPLMEKVNGKV